MFTSYQEYYGFRQNAIVSSILELCLNVRFYECSREMIPPSFGLKFLNARNISVKQLWILLQKTACLEFVRAIYFEIFFQLHVDKGILTFFCYCTSLFISPSVPEG